MEPTDNVSEPLPNPPTPGPGWSDAVRPCRLWVASRRHLFVCICYPRSLHVCGSAPLLPRLCLLSQPPEAHTVWLRPLDSILQTNIKTSPGCRLLVGAWCIHPRPVVCWSRPSPRFALHILYLSFQIDVFNSQIKSPVRAKPSIVPPDASEASLTAFPGGDHSRSRKLMGDWQAFGIMAAGRFIRSRGDFPWFWALESPHKWSVNITPEEGSLLCSSGSIHESQNLVVGLVQNTSIWVREGRGRGGNRVIRCNPTHKPRP